MWQSFTAIGQRSSEISWRNEIELKIRGSAQREAARGRESEWRDNLGADIVLLRTPPRNAIALAYTARTVYILGG